MMLMVTWAWLDYVSMFRKGERRYEGAEHLIAEGYLSLVGDKDRELVMATSSRGVR